MEDCGRAGERTYKETDRTADEDENQEQEPSSSLSRSIALPFYPKPPLDDPYSP
jgi:hypothetical protein